MKDKFLLAFHREGVLNIREIALFMAIFLFLPITYYYFLSPITVELTLQSPPKYDNFLQSPIKCPYENIIQLFYAGENQGYTENYSRKERIGADTTFYRFIVKKNKTLDSLKIGRKLRLDPIVYPGTIYLTKFVVKQAGYKPLILNSKNQFDLLKPVNDIEKMKYTPNGVIIYSSGCDPQLEIKIKPENINFDYLFFLKLVITVFVIGPAIYFLLGLLNNEGEFIYVPYLLMFVLALLFSTASICELMHLDEVVHVRAGDYYEDHWLPPEICAPGIEDTYSDGGVSRLDNFEVVYFFAGKFSKLLSFLDIGEFPRFRLFNVFLFSILLLLSIKHIEYRVLMLPLLMSPQIWYLFTYFNSDAFSLFIIIVISYQVIAENSMTNLYLTSYEDAKNKIIRPLLVGLLFSFLLLIKLNYYVFIVFLFLVFIHKLGMKEYQYPKKVMQRVGVIILISAAVFGVRWGIDISRNGINRNEKRMECRIKLAKPWYNPETPLEKRFPFKNLKDRNITIKQLFEKYNWGWKTFIHSFGVYFLFPRADLWYYRFIMAVMLISTIYLSASILIRRNLDQILLLTIVGFCSLLLIALSLWNSWTASFQAQGRYLFPILIMTGHLLHESLSILNKKIINFIVLIMFCLSVYSYVYIAMLQFFKP